MHPLLLKSSALTQYGFLYTDFLNALKFENWVCFYRAKTGLERLFG